MTDTTKELTIKDLYDCLYRIESLSKKDFYVDDIATDTAGGKMILNEVFAYLKNAENNVNTALDRLFTDEHTADYIVK